VSGPEEKSSEEQTAAQNRGAGWIWPVVKWSLFAVVAFFVARHAETLAGELSRRPAQVRWPFVAWAALVAAGAWTPSVLYWWRLVGRAGYPVPLATIVHAYWAGHIGKYVPGKAVAIAVRCTILKEVGVPLGVSARTAVQETLVSMLLGLAMLFALFPWLTEVSRWAGLLVDRFGLVGVRAWLYALSIAVVTIAIIVAGKSLLAGLVRRLTRKATDDHLPTQPTEGMSILETTGWAAFISLGWWLHGLALGLVTLAITTDGPGEMLARWPVWTAAAAAGTTVGFFVLIAPGGLAVREELVVDLTSPLLGGGPAVLLAALSRVAIFVGELLGLVVSWLWDRQTRDKG
jgi:hypothetical protein